MVLNIVTVRTKRKPDFSPIIVILIIYLFA